MYKVYAIRSKIKNYIYVGLTTNLEKRLKQHNKGYTKSTKPFRPFEIIYFEEVETRILARKREKYFKSGIGKEFLRKLI